MVGTRKSTRNKDGQKSTKKTTVTKKKPSKEPNTQTLNETETINVDFDTNTNLNLQTNANERTEITHTHSNQILTENIPTSNNMNALVAPVLQVQNAPSLDIRIAIKIVPDFDGNKDFVDDFVRSCKRANEAIAPNMRPFFIEMIRTKCIGEAHKYLSGRVTHSNLDDLLNDLKATFESKDNYEQLLSELVRIYQKREENVREFGGRVNTILKRLVDSINRTYTEVSAQGVIVGARDTAKSCFLAGLLDIEITRRIEIEKPKNLEEAIHEGLKAEQMVKYRENVRAQSSQQQDQLINEDHERRCNSLKRKFSPIRVNHTQEKNYNNRRETRTCFNCGKAGHFKASCRLPKQFKNNNYDNRSYKDNQYNGQNHNQRNFNRFNSHNKPKNNNNLNMQETRRTGATPSSNAKSPATYVSTTIPKN